MSNNLKRATATSMILLTIVVALAIQGLNVATAQDDIATYIMATSPGGTTTPAPGTTNTAPNGTNIVITATPDAGYVFLYWVASGNLTPGHSEGGQTFIIDPDTGEVLIGIPKPPTPTGIDSLAFTANPANITCGYGYTYTYQAIFAPAGGVTPSPSPGTTGDAIVVILSSTGGTTTPVPGSYAYPAGHNITLQATPSAGYDFAYWVVSGNATSGHTEPTPTYIIDPDTGEIIGYIPKPPVATGIDALTFTENPATITCGYGYTFQYSAVFMPVSATTAPPTTAPPTLSPSPTPAPTDWTVPIIAVVVIVIIIIIILAAVLMRRKK